MQTVLVKTRMSSGGWSARAGRGKAAAAASCTCGAAEAAQRAAAKYFRIDACNVIRPEDLRVTEIKLKDAGYGQQQFRVDLPDTPR